MKISELPPEKRERAIYWQKRINSSKTLSYIDKHPLRALMMLAVLGFVIYSYATYQEPPARVVDSSTPGRAKVVAALTGCVIPKIQYGRYSSYDNGESVSKLLLEECAPEYYDALASCKAMGRSEGQCQDQLAQSTLITIRQFGK